MMEAVRLDMEFVVHVSISLGRDFYIESFITDNKYHVQIRECTNKTLRLSTIFSLAPFALIWRFLVSV